MKADDSIVGIFRDVQLGVLTPERAGELIVAREMLARPAYTRFPFAEVVIWFGGILVGWGMHAWRLSGG